MGFEYSYTLAHMTRKCRLFLPPGSMATTHIFSIVIPACRKWHSVLCCFTPTSCTHRRRKAWKLRSALCYRVRIYLPTVSLALIKTRLFCYNHNLQGTERKQTDQTGARRRGEKKKQIPLCGPPTSPGCDIHLSLSPSFLSFPLRQCHCSCS
jgi:hypothetical protein